MAWEIEVGVCAPAPVLSVPVEVFCNPGAHFAAAMREHRQDPDRWTLGAMLTPAAFWPFPFLRVYVNSKGVIHRTSATPRWAVWARKARLAWIPSGVDLRPGRTSERLGRALAARPLAELDALCGVYDLGGVPAVQEVLRSLYDPTTDPWADRDSNVIARRA